MIYFALSLANRFCHFEFLAEDGFPFGVNIPLGDDHTARVVRNQHHLLATAWIRLKRIEAYTLRPGGRLAINRPVSAAAPITPP